MKLFAIVKENASGVGSHQNQFDGAQALEELRAWVRYTFEDHTYDDTQFTLNIYQNTGSGFDMSEPAKTLPFYIAKGVLYNGIMEKIVSVEERVTDKEAPLSADCKVWRN